MADCSDGGSGVDGGGEMVVLVAAVMVAVTQRLLEVFCHHRLSVSRNVAPVHHGVRCSVANGGCNASLLGQLDAPTIKVIRTPDSELELQNFALVMRACLPCTLLMAPARFYYGQRQTFPGGAHRAWHKNDSSLDFTNRPHGRIAPAAYRRDTNSPLRRRGRNTLTTENEAVHQYGWLCKQDEQNRGRRNRAESRYHYLSAGETGRPVYNSLCSGINKCVNAERRRPPLSGFGGPEAVVYMSFVLPRSREGRKERESEREEARRKMANQYKDFPERTEPERTKIHSVHRASSYPPVSGG
ncbi:hypothetical protein EAG_16278 [Camponotus floridanus]|uniref:Uncharacterized protein n=1 Tax=Camponotus floridanus TaxID=104421 RepID=E2AGA5_CAMFO|nr:hypothetical protein EAG_16278 [Camponotus floridanus]